jgi:hypothetical protein
MKWLIDMTGMVTLDPLQPDKIIVLLLVQGMLEIIPNSSEPDE